LSLPGGASSALNYPANLVILGNGQGFTTEKPAFGFPGGGLGPDNRISWYVGDSWKVKPNLTVTYGLRYVRDTGRTDSDLAPIPALNMFNNQFYSGLGNRVNNPNKNFAPQLGFAWDPAGNGKTVIRGGIGLSYSTVLVDCKLAGSYRRSLLALEVYFSSCRLHTVVPIPAASRSGSN
jgi:hypothetical protein